MAISILITASALLQFLITVAFAIHLRRQCSTSIPPSLPVAQQHSTWVLMSIRGADPSLHECVKGLLTQNFRQFQICVVVDHASDPAMDVLRRLQREPAFADRLTIRTLQKPLSTCTLKCSALAEGLDYIFSSDESAQYIAMIDADVGTRSDLLAKLLGALESDPSVGVVSGNQWFEPAAEAKWGTIVRSMWYAGALFFSILFQNPWAGAFAIRAKTARETQLADVWRRSAVDDGPVKQLMDEHGLACRSVAQLVMVNREPCTVSFVRNWMTRILTWSKIHEPTFWVTALQMAFSSALIIGIFSTLLWAIATADWFLATVSSATTVISGVLSVLAWTTIRRAVLLASGETFHPVSWKLFVKALFAVAVAQSVYAIACCGAMFRNKVQWRGVSYLVKNRSVELKQYHPFQNDDENGCSI